MSDQERIDKLSKDFQRLVNEQRRFVEEIRALKSQIDQLQSTIKTGKKDQPEREAVVPPVRTSPETSKTRIFIAEKDEATAKQKSSLMTTVDEWRARSSRDFERFIGENLINKIGILITVLGVGIGAKYSIDNDLISPQMRIILGYIAGLLLLVTGLKLKTRYANYSAVLTSGALAIFYFITYFSFSFYQLIPQTLAYALMTLFTIFGVVAALNYNQQIIALFGLIGAYAIPFLIGGNSDNPSPLFIYIAIINIGILTIAIRKYWHLVYYSAFIFTWMIFAFWVHEAYDYSTNLTTGLLFGTLFYLLFYATFIVNKLIQKLPFTKVDVLLILSNSFIYYGYGYAMLIDTLGETNVLGLFTIANALVHLIVSAVIFHQKLADRNLFYFVSGLVLVFLTIAVPVQLNGGWITLLWAGEALILFWVGHSRKISFYKKLSYPLIFLAFISQSIDWMTGHNLYAYDRDDVASVTPFVNIEFFTSLIYTLLLGGINYLAFIKPGPDPSVKKGWMHRIITFILASLFIFALYTTFRIEIEFNWQLLFSQSQLEITQGDIVSTIFNNNLGDLQNVWVINYSLLFCTILSWVTMRWVKHPTVPKIVLGLNIFAILIFLTAGLSAHSMLRSNYILQPNGTYYSINSGQLILRYVSYLLIAALWFMSLRISNKTIVNPEQKWIFQLGVHGTAICIASSELIHWLDLASITQSDKLGLSILWGIYALLLVVLGIWKKQKYLRVAAIGLFSITLIKLFTYDLTSLSTVGKTIVFVSLGILLLIISFLYNKYKFLIKDEHEAD